MSYQLCFDIYGSQAKGRRPKQEDAFECAADAGAAIGLLADGLGGHPCGDQASNFALTKAWNLLFQRRAEGLLMHGRQDAEESLQAAFLAGHREVIAQQHVKARCRDMGTTMACLMLSSGQQRFWAASVGDSRLLRVAGGDLVDAITQQRPVHWGTGGPGLRHTIGIHYPEEGLYVASSRVAAGDRFLLASDGLETLSLSHISLILRTAPTAQAAVESLLSAVDYENDPVQDNTTVIAMIVAETEADIGRPVLPLPLGGLWGGPDS